jgi:hypothetical protein
LHVDVVARGDGQREDAIADAGEIDDGGLDLVLFGGVLLFVALGGYFVLGLVVVFFGGGLGVVGFLVGVGGGFLFVTFGGDGRDAVLREDDDVGAAAGGAVEGGEIDAGVGGAVVGGRGEVEELTAGVEDRMRGSCRR